MSQKVIITKSQVAEIRLLAMQAACNPLSSEGKAKTGEHVVALCDAVKVLGEALEESRMAMLWAHRLCHFDERSLIMQAIANSHEALLQTRGK